MTSPTGGSFNGPEALLAPDYPLWHPYAPLPFPGPRAVFTRAEGAYVWDVEGKRYFDGTSSWWSVTHGHCHPRLIEALKRQAETLDHVMLSPHAHPAALELGSRLVNVLGKPFAKVFYSDDGSTAVECAMKMAVQYWHHRGERRGRFLGVEMAYHGDTIGAMGVGSVAFYHDPFDGVRASSFRATAPYCYRCPVGREFPTCRIHCLDSLEKVLTDHGKEIAAVIVEPLVLGAAGMIVYPWEYLERLVHMARRHGILVIFDEVFTGFGRTGTMFAMDQVSVRPDIVCLSKGLTGFLPLAATVTTAEIFSAFTGGQGKAFHHGHTFTGNPLGCAVAIESLKLFEEEKVVARNARLTAVMDSETPRFRGLPHVGEVRALGMIWAAELVVDKASRKLPEPANGPGWRIARALWERGYWLRPLHQMIYVVPPYCSGEDDLRGLFEVLYSELANEAHWA